MEKIVNLKPKNLNFLLNPWSILAGILLGIFIGLTNNGLTSYLTPLGKMYLSLLQMCIIPILITAVVSGLGKILSNNGKHKETKRMFLVFSIGLIFAALIGLTFGMLFNPGKGLSKEDRIVIGKVLSVAEINASPGQNASPVKLIDFLFNIVPKNVFSAITDDRNISILFFAIIFGIALGFVRSESSNVALSVMDGLYDSFQKMISWIMYGLPIGLCCLFATQVSQIGLDILVSLLRLVMLIYASAFTLMFIYHCIISHKTSRSFFGSLLALKETLFIAFGTSNSFAAIPSALKCLQKNLKLQKETTSLIIPLGMSINPQGSALHFAIASVFIAGLYGIDLGLNSMIIIVLGSALAGMAATGAPGVASIAMIAIVLEPLGLPVEAAIILLLAIDPILDPVLTLVNVHSNCAAATLIVEKPQSGG